MKLYNIEPLVSIITPVYNCGELILETFQSLQEQTYKNIEWIIVDDHSDRETVEILEDIKRDSDFEILIHRNDTNKRQAYSKNFGIKLSKGKYIRFLDSDDLIDNQLIEKQVSLLEKAKKNTIVYSPTKYFYGGGEKREYFLNESYKTNTQNDQLKKFLVEPFFSHCGCLFPRANSIVMKGFDASLTTDEDGLYILNMMLYGLQFELVDGVYFFYRKHNLTNRVSINDNIQKWNDRIKVCTILEQKMIELNKLNLYKNSLAQRLDILACQCYSSNRSKALKILALARRISPNYTPKQGKMYKVIRNIVGFQIAEFIRKTYNRVK